MPAPCPPRASKGTAGVTTKRDPHDLSPPKPLLYAIFAMVLFTIAMVATFRLLGLQPGGAISAAPAASIEIRLVEHDGGDVDVVLPPDDTVIASIAEDDSGFLRGMIRSLGRQRSVAGVPLDAPYRLARRKDGTLTLDDPLTQESIALRAYGPDNRDQMAVLLDKGLALSAPVVDGPGEGVGDELRDGES